MTDYKPQYFCQPLDRVCSACSVPDHVLLSAALSVHPSLASLPRELALELTPTARAEIKSHALNTVHEIQRKL